MTLEDCLLEQPSGFSANLHSESRNSAFHRLCNAAARKKMRAKEAPSIDFSLLWKAVSFPGLLLVSRLLARGFLRWRCPAEVPGQKVRVNLSVSQDNNNCSAAAAPYMERFKAALYILAVFWKLRFQEALSLLTM